MPTTDEWTNISRIFQGEIVFISTDLGRSSPKHFLDQLGVLDSGTSGIAEDCNQSIQFSLAFCHPVEALVSLENAERSGLELELPDQLVLFAVDDRRHLIVVFRLWFRMLVRFCLCTFVTVKNKWKLVTCAIPFYYFCHLRDHHELEGYAQNRPHFGQFAAWSSLKMEIRRSASCVPNLKIFNIKHAHFSTPVIMNARCELYWRIDKEINVSVVWIQVFLFSLQRYTQFVLKQLQRKGSFWKPTEREKPNWNWLHK